MARFETISKRIGELFGKTRNKAGKEAVMVDDQKIQHFDLMIRKGKGAAVFSEIQQWNLSEIPRDMLAPLAEIALRLTQYLMVLKILSAVVRPTRSSVEKATEKELMIYAAALMFLGALEESRKILAQLDPVENPTVWLYRSFLNFGEWDYQASIPHLRKYARAQSLSPYQKMIGKVNLAAALVNDRQMDEASDLLMELQMKTEKLGHTLLLGNCYELMAQVFIYRKSFLKAFEMLNKAKACLHEQQGTFFLFVKKWSAIAGLLQSKGDDKSRQNLEEVRLEAHRFQHWETLRDCDLFEACTTRNEALIRKVYFGTAFTGYRKRILELWEKEFPKSQEYLWQLHTTPAENPAIDLNRLGLFNERKLRKNSVLFDLFKALCLDFYKPARLGFLFSQTFPGEHFDPFSGPHRLNQVLYRLRKAFAEKSVPMVISVSDGEWKLKSDGPCAVRIGSENPVARGEVGWLTQLYTKTFGKIFTSAQAAEEMGCSQRQALELLKVGCREKLLVKIGRGPGTAYRFTRKFAGRTKFALL